MRLGTTGETSGPLTVLTTQSAPPSTAIYNQTVPSDGYGYLTTRDGIKLAYSVHPPTDVTNAEGFDLPDNITSQIVNHTPSPTLIEYSGYGYADPAGPQSGIAALANLMGYTVVDVNMRGTGCSGGAFDFFEPLQGLDGYDTIETVARQPWVANHKVGMLGISYGGISQLFTAQDQPPSLAAIAPLSVLDQTQTTLYPGGILNTGFAVPWAEERQHDALPAGPDTGQPWAYQRIQQGDTTCAANQALHPEATDLLAKIRANDHYVPQVADPLSPITFVNKINVPVFMACQWTDEQTGGHCPTLAEHMTGTSKKWFTFTNGTHVDSLDPATYERLYDFLELYVAKEAPILKSGLVNLSWPVAMQAIFGISGPGGTPPVATLPPDPIQLQPTYGLAKAAFDAQPQIRVLFDNGAGNSCNPGWPYPGFEQSFSSFPIPGTTARSWYLGTGGALADGPAATVRADTFTWDAHARPLTDFTGDTGGGPDGLWTATPNYQWSQDPAGTRRLLPDPAARQHTVVIGGRVPPRLGALLHSQRRPADDDQRGPAGRQGDLRAERLGAGQRAQARRGQEHARSSRCSACARPTSRRCHPDHFVEVTIPLYYEGHTYRSGSRIRVRISAPNGDQPIWSFGETDPPAGERRDRLRRRDAVTPRPPAGAGRQRAHRLPPCPGLRGEPCREYVPFSNAPGTPPGHK